MNPYLHEFVQRLRSRATIGLIVVALLGMAVSAADVDQDAPAVVLTGSAFSYYQGGAYHLEIWALDDTGHGVGGVRIELAFSNVTNSTTFPPPPPPVPFLFLNATTNAAGTAGVLLTVPPAHYGVTTSSTDAQLPQAALQGVLSGGFELAAGAPGQVQMIGSPLNVVFSGAFVSQEQLMVFWAGANGGAPTGDELEACTPVVNSGYAPPFNCSGQPAVRIGPIAGYLSYFPYPALATPAIEALQQVFLTLQIVAPNGTVAYASSFSGPDGPQPAGVTGPPYQGDSPGVSATTSVAQDLGFFLPLGGFLLVYWGTTRPRFSGSTDMVLVRPVTRRGLFLTRWAALVFLLGLVVVAEILFFDAFASVRLGASPPATFALALVGAGLVAAVAFSELILLGSHVFRTTGPTLGIGIGLLLVGSLFWPVVVALLYSLLGLTTAGALQLQLLPPLQYLSVVAGSLNGRPIFAGPSTVYGSVGVTPAVIVAVGAIWIAVPLLTALHRAMRRD